MAQKRENPSQIIRIDGKGCFMEVLNDSFSIGKVHLGFYSYDMNKAAGNRFTNNIQIYLDMPEFLALSSDILFGRMARLAQDSLQKAQSEGNKYARLIFESMGGTSADRLKKIGQARTDGMGISRQFKITPGSQKPYLLSAESGPGQADEKGLIVPKYKGQAEQRVMVPMDATMLQRFILIVQMHIQGYITAHYVANPQEGQKKHTGDTQNNGYAPNDYSDSYDNANNNDLDIQPDENGGYDLGALG